MEFKFKFKATKARKTAIKLYATTAISVAALVALPNSSQSYAERLSFGSQIVDAAEYGESEKIQALVYMGSHPDERGEFETTALIRAAYHGNIEIAEFLLETGANPDLADLGGATALHIASREGHYDLAKLLLEYGAQINVEDDEGNTPLMNASSSENSRVTKLLLANGAEANQTNDVGESAIVYAAESNNEDSFLALVDSGADVETINQEGDSVVEIAEMKSNPQMLASIDYSEVSPIEKPLTLQMANSGKENWLSNLREVYQQDGMLFPAGVTEYKEGESYVLIDLGSFKDRNFAEKRKGELETEHADSFDDVNLTILDNGDGSFTLNAGIFNNKDTALSICRKLVFNGISCRPMETLLLTKTEFDQLAGIAPAAKPSKIAAPEILTKKVEAPEAPEVKEEKIEIAEIKIPEPPALEIPEAAPPAPKVTVTTSNINQKKDDAVAAAKPVLEKKSQAKEEEQSDPLSSLISIFSGSEEKAEPVKEVAKIEEPIAAAEEKPAEPEFTKTTKLEVKEPEAVKKAEEIKKEIAKPVIKPAKPSVPQSIIEQELAEIERIERELEGKKSVSLKAEIAEPKEKEEFVELPKPLPVKKKVKVAVKEPQAAPKPTKAMPVKEIEPASAPEEELQLAAVSKLPALEGNSELEKELAEIEDIEKELSKVKAESKKEKVKEMPVKPRRVVVEEPTPVREEVKSEKLSLPPIIEETKTVEAKRFPQMVEVEKVPPQHTTRKYTRNNLNSRSIKTAYELPEEKRDEETLGKFKVGTPVKVQPEPQKKKVRVETIDKEEPAEIAPQPIIARRDFKSINPLTERWVVVDYFANERTARGFWSETRKKSGVDPKMRMMATKQLTGRGVYSAMIGPFDNSSSASNFCNIIAPEKLRCTVQKNVNSPSRKLSRAGMYNSGKRHSSLSRHSIRRR